MSHETDKSDWPRGRYLEDIVVSALMGRPPQDTPAPGGTNPGNHLPSPEPALQITAQPGDLCARGLAEHLKHTEGEM